jgi:hypothetical protein
MSEQLTSHGAQPDFAWIPERKRLAKLFTGVKQREAVAQGRSPRYFVFPWGVSWINGDEEVSARWGEVGEVWRAVTRHSTNGVHTHTEYVYTLKLADGRSGGFRGRLRRRQARASQAVRLEPVSGVTTPVTIEQLGRLLDEGVTRAKLPQAIDRFNAGQAVSFGPLTVSPSGISADDRALPWSEIQQVRTWQGYVSVRKSGKWLAWKTARVAQIPNYFVFDALVRAILAQRPPSGAH